MKQNKLYFISMLVLVISSCESDFLDTEPTRIVSEEQLAGESSATNLILRGAYAKLRTNEIGGTTSDTDFGHMGIKAGLDMMSNDIVLNNFNWYIFWHNYNGRAQNSTRTRAVWNTYYKVIFDTNTVINTLSGLERNDEQNTLLGQALALKASSLFNLVRVYALSYVGNQNELGVPLPNGIVIGEIERSTVQQVYDQIISDLKASIDLLEGFTRGSKQIIDQSVAYGFLARVYIETQNWEGALENAKLAREGFVLMSGDDWVTSGFADISNVEWMWGSDINAETSTIFASFFSHFDARNGGYGGELEGFKLIDRRLYEAIADTDRRKDAFIGAEANEEEFPGLPPYTNLKFTDATRFEGDYVYMRSAEMYLMEAEALAKMGYNGGAAQILFELISTRDSEYELSSSTGDALLEEIYLQRRIELWGEGFAWYDMKRLGVGLDREYEGSNHKDFGKLTFAANSDSFRFQIPEEELNSNDLIGPNEQNP